MRYDSYQRIIIITVRMEYGCLVSHGIRRQYRASNRSLQTAIYRRVRACMQKKISPARIYVRRNVKPVCRRVCPRVRSSCSSVCSRCRYREAKYCIIGAQAVTERTGSDDSSLRGVRRGANLNDCHDRISIGSSSYRFRVRRERTRAQYP